MCLGMWSFINFHLDILAEYSFPTFKKVTALQILLSSIGQIKNFSLLYQRAIALKILVKFIAPKFKVRGVLDKEADFSL